MSGARRRDRARSRGISLHGSGIAASLLGLTIVVASCGPDLVFDNECDKASSSFDACLCRECPAETRCVEDLTDKALGVSCTCGHAKGWCVDQVLCCPATQVCDGVKKDCCTPQCGGRECGDDGCGNPDGCGTCDSTFGFSCNKDGLCVVSR